MHERSGGCISLANSRYPEGFNFGRSNRREGSPDGSLVKSPPANAGAVSPISWVGKSSEEGNSNPLQYSSLEIPWTGEPGRLQSMGSQRVKLNLVTKQGFPHSSVRKESTCNAGDSGSIPGLGRSAGEGIGYPFQCSWTSLVAQLVKNPLAMQETLV